MFNRMSGSAYASIVSWTHPSGESDHVGFVLYGRVLHDGGPASDELKQDDTKAAGRTETQTHTKCTHAHIDTHTHAHTHTQGHTHTHTHIHTLTHAHTHTHRQGGTDIWSGTGQHNTVEWGMK